MPRAIKTFGAIRGGKLYITDRPAFDAAVGDMKAGAVEVTVKHLYAKRSLSQNAYYRGVVVPLIADALTDAWGEDISEEEAHDQLKSLFNVRTIDTENGTVSLIGSTSKLTTVEFSAYVEKCVQWAASFLSINIPDPLKIEGAKDQLRA